MFELDHIAVAGETLAVAVAHCEDKLDLRMGPGGQHTHYATHNQLVGLADGLYLEAIATDPAQPTPPYPRWFGLDRFHGPARLDKWILRCSDIEAAHEAFPDIGTPVHLTRGSVSWTMIVPDDGVLPHDGLFPAFIQWHTDTPPGVSLPPTDFRLRQLMVRSPQANDIAARLAPVFQDPRVAFEESDTPRLSALFDTPDGTKVLT